MIRFTPEQEKLIYSMYNDGMNPGEIGKEFNVSYSYIIRFLKKNIKTRNMTESKSIFNIDKEQEICSLYKDGLNSVEISRLFNVSETPIVRILKKNNIMRSKSESKKLIKKINFSSEEGNKIIEFYNNELSSYKISEILKSTPSKIYDFLICNNIKLRTKSESIKLFLKTPEGHKLRSDNRKKQIPPMLGKHQTEKQKKIVSENNWTKTKEGRIKVSEKTKKLWKDPEYKEMMSKMSKELWKDPEYIEQHIGKNHGSWKGGKDVSVKKRQEKRKDFISNSLNEKFPNSEEHHINKETTIYLPKQIHSRKCGIIHNLHTGYCMNVINTIAYFFLVQQNIQKLNRLFKEEKQ